MGGAGPPVGYVDIWHAGLSPPPAALGRLAALLTPDEQARAARFHFARDRDRYLAGRGMLRVLLAGYTGTDPAALRFVYGAHGKPALAETGPAFNVAHSQDQIVVAVAARGPLGVDLEWVRPIPDAWAIAAHYFTPGELADLRALPAAEFPRGFYAAWTRKEAFLKAVGSGLAVPLDAVEVSLRPGDPPALRRVPPDQATVPWQLYDLDLHPACRAALVTAGPAQPVVRRWPGLAAE